MKAYGATYGTRRPTVIPTEHEGLRCYLRNTKAYGATYGTRRPTVLHTEHEGLRCYLRNTKAYGATYGTRRPTVLPTEHEGLRYSCIYIVIFLTHSTLVSKLFFLAVQGSGALLSSNLEGALYKSP